MKACRWYLGCALVNVAEFTLAASATSSSVLERGASNGVDGGYLIKLVAGLGLVLASILVLAWALKRLQRLPSKVRGALRIIGALSVGPRERLLLVQVGETQLLVGVAPGRISGLLTLTTPVEMNEEVAQVSATAFAKLLSATQGSKAP